MSHIRIVTILLLSVLLLVALAPAPAARPADEGADIVRKITAAMPATAPVKPERLRRVLVFSRCESYRHAAIPTCETAIRIMGEKTGAFETVVTDGMSAFEPEFLATFDAVLLNNTTRLKFDDPRRRQALLDFVRGGKGLIGIHAATDNFYDWPEAAAMMGGLFDGHPWGAGGTWAFKIDEPDHVLTSAFGGAGFVLSDEIYQIKGPYSRTTLRVLLSLDMSNSRNLQVNGIKRDDGDFAVSWIRRFGKGRVFYCSLGHNHAIYWNPAVLGHYLAGIQYALGDLQADDTPGAKLKLKPKPARSTDAGAPDDPIPGVAAYDFGASRVPLANVEAMIRVADPAERSIIEARLLAILQCPETTFAGKQFACRMLRRAGSVQSIPVLKKLLYDEKLSDAARFALQGYDSPAVDEALRRALGALDGARRIGVIGTIAQRGDEAAVPQIAGLIASADENLARAAIAALGTIGGVRAAAELERTRPAVPGLEDLRDDSLLLCADRMLAGGRGVRAARSEAVAIYESLSPPSNAPMVRVAAYRGLVRAAVGTDGGALSIILAMLSDGVTEVRQAAGRLVAATPGIDVRALAGAIPKLAPDAQALVLAALAARGDAAAASAAVAACTSEHSEVRSAALSALGFLGGHQHVELLARTAAKGGDEGAAAAGSLRRMGGRDVDAAILEGLHSSKGEVRCALIRCLEPRHISTAVHALFICACDKDPAVRKASLEALKGLATPEDLHGLIALLSSASDSGIDDDIEGVTEAILAACRRIDEGEKRTDFLLSALPELQGQARAALLEMLGELPNKRAMEALCAALGDEDPAARLAAVRSLAGWPDPAPLANLLDFVGKVAAEKERAAAFEGAVRLAGLPAERKSAETAKIFDRLGALATGQAETEKLIEGTVAVADLWVLKFLDPYQADAASSDVAGAVRERIVNELVKKVDHDAKGCAVTLVETYVDRYSGGSKNALTDGKWGSTDYRDGCWQGFQGKDLDATVDLGRAVAVRSMRAGFLQINNSWIFLPTEVEFALSEDGKHFVTVTTVELPVPTEMQDAATQIVVAHANGRQARFVRVRAKNIGVLPDWHPGNGGTAWLFADEIQVNPHFEE